MRLDQFDESGDIEDCRGQSGGGGRISGGGRLGIGSLILAAIAYFVFGGSPSTTLSGLNAAHKIGDDYLQKQAQGYAVPDSFTHGSSAQHVRWFAQGLKTGDWRMCDTFRANTL